MKFSSSLAFLAGVVSTVSAYATFKHTDSNIIPNRYIVELSSMSGFSKRGGDEQLDPHAEFHSHMKRAGLPYSVVSTFNSESYLMGASIEVSDSDIEQVQSMASVKAVYPVRLVPRPRPFGDKVNAVSGSAANPTDTFSTHQMTGVDKLHNAGIYGKGVLVAEIDTGIDYTHPALGGCFGPGCKVVKGYDFVGDDYDGTNNPVPDDDPKDCAGHGTHVAGIIGADANPLNFTGVAPQASLAAYRVFGCTGSAGTDIIIAAMIRAANEGADIISMSLGDTAGWTESIDSVVAQRIVQTGIIVSISQGNSGAEGLFYTSSPASGLGTITVSSVDNVITPAMVAFVSSDPTHPIATSAQTFKPPHDVAYPIYISTDIQACSPIDVDLANIVVVAQRGTCPFSVKADNVLKAGGSVLLVYNNVAGSFTADFGKADIVGAAISMEDGESVVAAYNADKTLTITFPSDYYNLPNTLTPGLVSDFTSYGPTFDQYFKPSVAAPGGNILSTWPVALGSYTVISGTSMACPFISGVAALMLSVNGKLDPLTVRYLLETTSVPIATTAKGSLLNTVVQQGGGLVDAFAAVNFKALVSPGEVPLNDTLHAVTQFTVTIQNYGASSNSYRISNVPAQAALTFSQEGAQPNLGPVPLVDGAAEVSFSETFVTVAPGEFGRTEVTVSAPQGLDPKNVPVYSGFVKVVSADGSEVYTIPYAGTAASMFDDFPIFDTTNDIFGFSLPALVGADGEPLPASAANSVSSPANSTTPSFTFAGTDKPELLYRLIGGTAMMYLDLVPADTLLNPTIGGMPVNASSVPEKRMSKMVKKASLPDVGSIGQLSVSTYNYRNGHSSEARATPNGVLYFDIFLSARGGDGLYFGNGQKVPNGNYKLLVRGLKFYGDETSEASYESWLSPAFNVNQS